MLLLIMLITVMRSIAFFIVMLGDLIVCVVMLGFTILNVVILSVMVPGKEKRSLVLSFIC
jgi:hypothetical protein